MRESLSEYEVLFRTNVTNNRTQEMVGKGFKMSGKMIAFDAETFRAMQAQMKSWRAKLG